MSLASRRFGLAALALCVLPAVAQARPVTYVCTLDVPAADSWVPEQVVIRHVPGETVALVNDPIIKHFAKKPLPADVVVDNASRITFRWALKMITNTAGQTAPDFIYRATVQKSGFGIRITAKPAGYGNFFEAGGTCRQE